MKIKVIFKNLGYISSCLVLITGGYLLGTRNKIDGLKNNITTVTSNNFSQNSLSQIQTKDISGAINQNSLIVFGQFYYKIIEDKTEILVKLNNIPANVKTETQNKPIPNQLKISLAKRNLNGLTYEYIQIGTINLDSPVNDLRSGTFSTILETNDKNLLANSERVVFEPLTDAEANIFKDSNPDLPQEVREKPAPYFWVVL
jgi:hypothetical protein